MTPVDQKLASAALDLMPRVHDGLVRAGAVGADPTKRKPKTYALMRILGKGVA